MCSLLKIKAIETSIPIKDTIILVIPKISVKITLNFNVNQSSDSSKCFIKIPTEIEYVSFENPHLP